MADDAFACFNALLETVPDWIADLEGILKAAQSAQQEMLFACQPAETTPEPSNKAKSKSSSLKLRQSQDSSQKRGNETQKPRLLQRPSLKHLTNSDALRLSQRKRKTASVASGDQSGPPKFRVKAAAVVYYDGDTQKRFEKLVRAVGSSRNAIRKGKMSAKVENLARAGSGSSEASSSSGGEENSRPVTTQLNYEPPRPPRLSTLYRINGAEAFDKVDGRLEKAQTICERAAHQVLRDGDCTVEVTNAKEHFSEALKLAEAELPGLKKMVEKAAERRRRSEERRRIEEEEEDEEKRRQSASEFSEKLMNVVTSFPPEGALEVDMLEVDDESDDEGEFNLINAMPTFGKFAHMRASRLAAH